MKTYKILLLITVILLVVIGFGSWYYISRVGADTLPVVKSTVVQAVDSNGKEVKAIIPLELQIRVRNLQCEEMNIFFKKLGGKSNGKVCKTQPGIIIKTVKTDANGSITISDNLLSKVSNTDISNNAKDYLESELNTKLTDDESKQLEEIANTVTGYNSNQNGTNTALSELISSIMKRNGLGSQVINSSASPTSDLVRYVYGIIFSAKIHLKNTNTILSLSGDKIIESVSVRVDSKALRSETLNVSFLESEYTEKASLIVYAGNLVDLQNDSTVYLDQYAKENNLNATQTDQYNKFLQGFFNYETTQIINSLGSNRENLKSIFGE